MYKAKIEYIEQLEGYIVLVLIDGKWCRCGSNQHLVVVFDFEEDALMYINDTYSLELYEIKAKPTPPPIEIVYTYK